MNAIAADPIDSVNLNSTVVAIADPMTVVIAIDLDFVVVVAGILFVIKIQKHSYLGSSILWLHF